MGPARSTTAREQDKEPWLSGGINKADCASGIGDIIPSFGVTHTHTLVCASLWGRPQADGSKRSRSQTASSKSPARRGSDRATPLTYIIINKDRLTRACDNTGIHTHNSLSHSRKTCAATARICLGVIISGLLRSVAASMGFLCLRTGPASAKQDWHKGANNVGARLLS